MVEYLMEILCWYQLKWDNCLMESHSDHFYRDCVPLIASRWRYIDLFNKEGNACNVFLYVNKKF